MVKERPFQKLQTVLKVLKQESKNKKYYSPKKVKEINQNEDLLL
jgi:hypothetical protein